MRFGGFSQLFRALAAAAWLLTGFGNGQTFTLDSVASGFGNVITDIQHAGDDRLFVVTREGTVRIIKFPDCTAQVLPTPFLDINSLVRDCSGGCERGLLGLAFHPDYANNGYFFIHYSDNSDDSVFARYQVDASNPDIADPSSAQILHTEFQPATNHNGGQLQFGHDGMLYIALGDGGSSYDRADPNDPGKAQNMMTLLGKMLRVDVDNFSATTWEIPADNPFVNDPNVLDEIWNSGLRNPWRFSVDRLTGDLYIADVGQGAWEEVNLQASGSSGGENYGWCVCESLAQITGFAHCNAPAGFDSCATSYTPPIFDYAHSGGGSITGGYIYRGTTYPNLQGAYFYADYVQDFIRGAKLVSGSWVPNAVTTSFSGFGAVTTFGEDSSGEQYVGTFDGVIYKIKDPTVPDPPCATAWPSSSPTAPTSEPSKIPTLSPISVVESCPAQYEASYPILPGALELQYSVVPSTEEYGGILCAQLVYQGLAWLSLGFSTDFSMLGSEAVIATTDSSGINSPSNPNPGKYDLTSRQTSGIIPIPQGQTLIDASIAQDATTTTLTFTKLLIEPGEIAIDATGTNRFIWAVGFADVFSKHAQAGDFFLDFTPCSARSDCVNEPSCDQIDCVNNLCQDVSTAPCGDGFTCSLPCTSCGACNNNEASCVATSGCTFQSSTLPACALSGCRDCTNQQDCSDAGCNWRKNSCKGSPSGGGSSGSTCTGTADVTCAAAPGDPSPIPTAAPSISFVPTETPVATPEPQGGCGANLGTNAPCAQNCECASGKCRTNGAKANTCT